MLYIKINNNNNNNNLIQINSDIKHVTQSKIQHVGLNIFVFESNLTQFKLEWIGSNLIETQKILNPNYFD